MSKLTQKAHSTIRSFNEKVGPYAKSAGVNTHNTGLGLMGIGLIMIIFVDPIWGILIGSFGWFTTSFIEKCYFNSVMKSDSKVSYNEYHKS